MHLCGFLRIPYLFPVFVILGTISVTDYLDSRKDSISSIDLCCFLASVDPTGTLGIDCCQKNGEPLHDPFHDHWAWTVEFLPTKSSYHD